VPKGRSLFAVLILTLATVGCKQTAPAPGAGGAGAFAVPVTLAKATRESVPLELNAVGTVEASAVVQVKALVAGQLLSAAFTEGEVILGGTTGIGIARDENLGRRIVLQVFGDGFDLAAFSGTNRKAVVAEIDDVVLQDGKVGIAGISTFVTRKSGATGTTNIRTYNRASYSGFLIATASIITVLTDPGFTGGSTSTEK